jgi:hypothetical protein
MHLEVIARIQDKTVLCVHWNETTIVEGLKCKFTYINLYYAVIILQRNSRIYPSRLVFFIGQHVSYVSQHGISR